MKYRIERLEMSGRGPRVMWTIIDCEGRRVFPTKYGFSCWKLKREAKEILNKINSLGLDQVRKELAKYQ